MMKFGNNNLMTTALSPGERENRAPSSSAVGGGDCSKGFRAKENGQRLFPLFGGGGQSEDEPKHHPQSDCIITQYHAFTLLELLLAILVFAIVLGAIHVVFFSAFKLRNKTSEAIERSLPLQQTLAIIKRDIADVVPPGGTFSGALQSTPTISPTPGTTSSGSQSTTGSATTTASSSSQGGIGSSGAMSGLLNGGFSPDFYTAVGIVDDSAPWGDIERVSYYLAQPTNNTPGMDLYRSVTRNLLPVMQDDTEDQFLMSGVDAISFQYYDGNAWQDTWDSTQVDPATGLTNNLPSAIKVELQLHPDSNASGIPAPVELIVPIMVAARTNATETIE